MASEINERRCNKKKKKKKERERDGGRARARDESLKLLSGTIGVAGSQRVVNATPLKGLETRAERRENTNDHTKSIVVDAESGCGARVEVKKKREKKGKHE